jgi:hypothetical protein
LQPACSHSTSFLGPWATTITFASSLDGLTLLLNSAYGTIVWDGDNITVTGGLQGIAISGLNLNAGDSIFRIEGENNLLENLTVSQRRRTASKLEISAL